ncbi:MAG: hypothetical protein M1831_001737 [Alyxoria varia]|nr:MAG: hypothetical protein M1831_001737 [Alyxoria varia]
MAEQQQQAPSDETGSTEQQSPQITFTVKSSADHKYSISIPESTTVADLKTKLSTSEYADIPADRQRLIYSGRVLKDQDTLGSYKVKDGNTIHMVKSAASNQKQNPPDQSGGDASTSAGGVPQNIASGPGNDPLAGLTGARYAGFAQMPGASNFGPDGGMGVPQGPEDMLRMLDNPMVQSQMNEAMNNPHVIQMMQNSPMVRNNPMMREMLNNPEMRRMLMDPQFIRSSMRMSEMMGGGPGARGQGGAGGMPAPGVTDTTQGQGQGGDAAGQGGSDATGAQDQGQNQPNPFAMFGGGGGGGGFGGGLGGAGQGQDNPFAALLGGGAPFGAGATAPGTGAGDTNPTGQTGGNAPSDGSQQQQQQPGQDQQGQGQQQQTNPFASMAQQMMQNPDMMRSAMQMLGGGGGMGGMGGGMGAGGMGGAPGNPGQQPGDAGPGTGAGAGSDPNATNPFAALLGGGMGGPGMGGLGGGMGGLGGMGGGMGGDFGGAPAAQQDTRPPEELYAEQLQQLNDMGFYEFERNVRALRMAGGRVEGAVEMLLGGTV